MIAIILSVIYGSLGGALTGIGIFFKNTAGEEEKKEGFNSKKFFISVLTSAIIGGIASYGIDPSPYTITIGGFAGLFVENIIKGIKRRRKNVKKKLHKF